MTPPIPRKHRPDGARTREAPGQEAGRAPAPAQAAGPIAPLGNRVGGAVLQRQERPRPSADTERRAQAIISELGPLIMSDQVVIDNLRGADLEPLLRRLDSVQDAGHSYLGWMLKRVDGSEQVVMDDLLLSGVTSPALMGRLVVILIRDLSGTDEENERLLVSLVERLNDQDLYAHVISRGVSLVGLRGTVDTARYRDRLDLRLRRYSQSVARGVEQRATRDLNARQDRESLAHPDREVEIISLTQDLIADVAVAREQLEATYLYRAGHESRDADERDRLDLEFRQELYRLETAIGRQHQLTLQYGILFGTSRATYLETPTIQLFRRRFWTVEELDRVDAILQRVPRRYLSRIRKISREADEAGTNAGASWNEPEFTLRIYSHGFTIDRDRFELAVLHEIGHSTMPWQTSGGFRSLPDAAWMSLSDWRMSTRAALGPDLGLSPGDTSDLLQALDRQSTFSAGTPAPIYRAGRAVVWDPYERGFHTVPGQFLHYDQRFDDQFVTPYARRHPAEDFAESFALFMRDPDRARRLLDVGAPGVTDKWDYLVAHYPARLNP